jgi:hypothetical protein
MSFGVGGRLYRWIRDFLTSRQQRVVLSGQTSSWSKINAGIPQGSILGPTLFLIFLNDLTIEVENHIDLFADDTTLYQYLNSENRQNVIKSLQRDLDTIKIWAEKWMVLYNAKKTQVMTISTKKQQLKESKFIFIFFSTCDNTDKEQGDK